MIVVDFIREKGLQALTDELGVAVREYDDFICLNYDMIESPKAHPVVMECRGLILNRHTMEVVCRPLTRFFNFGEADTQDFDFSNCRILEKADGSYIKIWFNDVDRRWEIGTRSTAFAEPNHAFGSKTDWTFREAVLDAMHFTEEQFQDCMFVHNQNFTILAEYVSPFNRIVTRYDEPHMVLLGARHRNGEEKQNLILLFESLKNNKMNVRLPEVYNANSVDEVLKMCEELPDLKEGFVCQEIVTGRRVKIKNKQYIVAHQLRGNGTPTLNNIMEVVLSGETDELLSYFPEFSVFIDPVEYAKKVMLHSADMAYTDNWHHESQKDFALSIKDLDCAPILFAARKKNITVLQTFNEMEMNQKKNLLSRYLD